MILNIPNIELLRHYSYRPIFNTVNFGQLAIAIAVFLAYSSMTYQFNSLYRKFALFSLILIVMGIVTFYYIEESCERTAIIQLSEMDLYHTNELLANHPDDLDNLPDTILFILDYPFSEGVPPFYINPAFRNGYSGIWEDIQFNQANYNVLTEDNLNAYLNNLTALPINSHEETIFTVSPENRVNHFVLVKSSMGEKNLVIGFSLNHLLLDMQNHLIKFTLIIGCGSLAVGVLFYIFLRTNLIQPLQNLLTGIEKVSRGEFENSRLKVTGYDEVSIISEAFNSLTRMIQQKESDLHLLSEEYIAEIKKTAEMQHTAQHYLALASIDYLTSIPNRRSFLSQAQTIYDSAVGGDSVLGFFMIDIDNFKLVNDRYGHAIGDLVLQRVAQSIKASLRNNDIVGRYGGEEFVILVNTISNEIVEQIAERIRGAIQEIKFSFSENTRPFSITISIGFTTRRKEDTLQAMIQRADEGLYVSKKEGKNRVTFIQ
ncbi:MAG: diguanylate cyclase [Anaerolineales bacterium]|nr:diguanylate cyclase [Anaerolineales bacterium]